MLATSLSSKSIYIMSKSRKLTGANKLHHSAMLVTNKMVAISQQLKAAADKKRGLIAVLCLIAFVVSYHLSHAAGASEAVLYLFADNGKKSGRQDGNVYMRNGRSRGFKVPALVRNAYTAIARNNVTSFSAGWGLLTEAQRIAWNNFSYTNSDRFGRPITISGKQAYVGLNTNLINAGQVAIVTPPVTLAGITTLYNLDLTASAVGDTLAMTFLPTPTLAGTTVLVFGTAPQKPGISRPSQSKYRLIGTLPAATASPAALATMYKAKYGATAISANLGAKVFLYNIVVQNTTGEASAPNNVSCIIAA